MSETTESSPFWIQTWGIRALDLLHPKPEQIDFESIATSLSRIPRYLGHTRAAISVAEHSVHVSRAVRSWEWTTPLDEELRAAAGLIHDAHEFGLGDMPGPLKALLRAECPQGAELLRRLENRLDGAICVALARHVGGPDEFQEIVVRGLLRELATAPVKAVDLSMLGIEKDSGAGFGGQVAHPWSVTGKPWHEVSTRSRPEVLGLEPEAAKALWLGELDLIHDRLRGFYTRASESNEDDGA